MNFKKNLAFAITGLLTAGSGCATHRAQSDGDGGKPANEAARMALYDSSVDIAYVLGHSHRRFVAWAKKDTFGGQTLLDHQILRESGIERNHYSEFFGKVEQFVNTPKRKPAEQGTASNPSALVPADDSCRTPFTVTVRVGTETQILQGCRAADDGTLSRLVRDGEFLLYSAK